MATPVDLRRVDCSSTGRGPWTLVVEPERRRVRVVRRRSKATYTVFYGTRTERTLEDAERYATALCAVLNALKAKRC
jgi:hypothetical protein